MKRSKKLAKKLAERQADSFLMVAKPRSDGWAGYKKPGSNSK